MGGRGGLRAHTVPAAQLCVWGGLCIPTFPLFNATAPCAYCAALPSSAGSWRPQHQQQQAAAAATATAPASACVLRKAAGRWPAARWEGLHSRVHNRHGHHARTLAGNVPSQNPLPHSHPKPSPQSAPFSRSAPHPRLAQLLLAAGWAVLLLRCGYLGVCGKHCQTVVGTHTACSFGA